MSALQGNPMSNDDGARKAEIEYLMRWDRPRYFRDELMQQEYRDILEREEAAPAAPPSADALRKAAIEGVMRTDRPHYEHSGMDREYLAILERELNPPPAFAPPRTQPDRTGILPDAREGLTDLSGIRGARDATAKPNHMQLAVADPAKLTGIAYRDGRRDDKPESSDHLMGVAQQSPTDETVGQGREEQDALTRAIGEAQKVVPEQKKAIENLTPDGHRKHKGEIEIEKLPKINAIIEREAKAAGINPRWLKIIAFIESGGNPLQKTGSYLGLFQFDPDKSWKDFGERGKILDPTDSTRAMIRALKNYMWYFVQKYGRDPTLPEIFAIHNQGPTGSARLFANLDGKAWESLARGGTPEARAKQKIRGNLWDEVRPETNDITSRRFIEHKFAGGTGYGKLYEPTPAIRADQKSGIVDESDMLSSNYSWQGQRDLSRIKDMADSVRLLRDVKKGEKPRW